MQNSSGSKRPNWGVPLPIARVKCSSVTRSNMDVEWTIRECFGILLWLRLTNSYDCFFNRSEEPMRPYSRKWTLQKPQPQQEARNGRNHNQLHRTITHYTGFTCVWGWFVWRMSSPCTSEFCLSATKVVIFLVNYSGIYRTAWSASLLHGIVIWRTRTSLNVRRVTFPCDGSAFFW